MSDTTAAISNEPELSQGSDESEAQRLLSLLQRERADFLNYKRRAIQERGEERERARAELLVELLPLLDDLDLAMAEVPEGFAEHPWPRGVLLGRRRLLDFLSKIGVEPIGTADEPFDPTRHLALFYEERPGIGEPRVANVIRLGYRMGSRMLRPAQVGVVGPADEPTEAAAGRDGEVLAAQAEDVGTTPTGGDDGEGNRHRSGNDELGGSSA